MKDQWDIYDVARRRPRSSEDLESIAPPKGACNMSA